MLQLLMKLFCLHVYEYEHMEEIGEHKECRKCGINKPLEMKLWGSLQSELRAHFLVLRNN